jgi:hypothetical protein
MPVHEYCFEDRKDCVDVLFYVGEKVPPIIDGKRRVVSAPAIKIAGSLRHHNLEPGIQVFEAGMDKDVKRAKQARIDKQDKERSEFISKELSGFNL